MESIVHNLSTGDSNRDRRKKWRASVLMAIMLMLEIVNTASAQIDGFGNVRVAHIQYNRDHALPDGFLKLVASSGYTHVMVELAFDGENKFIEEWDGDGKPVEDRLSDMFFTKNLVRLFKQVDSYDLILIPLIQTHNIHSNYLWAIDKDLPIQVKPENIPKDKWKRVGSFSPEDKAMERLFSNIISVVVQAFDDARPNLKHKNLDFIHIGLDEYTYRSGIPKDWVYLVTAGLCPEDQDWINANATSPKGRIYELIAACMRARVEEINYQTKAYGYNTRTMVYADMFDPELFGGGQRVYTLKDLNGNYNVNNREEISTQKILHKADAQAIRDDVVLMPWSYNYEHPSLGFYNADVTYAYFRDLGFQFLQAFTGAEARKKEDEETKKCIGTILYPMGESRVKHIDLVSTILQKEAYKSNAIGYAAVHWVNYASGEKKCGWKWCMDRDYNEPFKLIELLPTFFNSRILKY